MATVFLLFGYRPVRATGEAPPHVPGRLAVELVQVPSARDLVPAELENWVKAHGADIQPHFPGSRNEKAWTTHRLGAWWLVQTGAREDIPALCAELRTLSGVRGATPDWISHLSIAPNDPLFPDQWALDNTGQARALNGEVVGLPGLDLGALTAWDLGVEAGSTVIAVLDTGVDPDHPEFHNRLLPGFNFITNLPGAVDDNGHGTAVSSLLGARVNNLTGLAGMSRHAQILPLKVFNSIGQGTASALANALNYARQLQVTVANYSGGMSQDYGPAIDVIEAAYDEGMWTVAAAGNSGASVLEFPARLPVCLAVGAMSPCGERKTSSSCDGETGWASNFGQNLDYLAPGVRLTSAIRGGGYRDDFNGSSAACAYLSGALALIRGVEPVATREEIEIALRESALDLGDEGYDETTGFGLVRIDHTLLLLNPPLVGHLVITTRGGAVLLAWTTVPAASSYVIEACEGLDQPFRIIAETTATTWTSGPRELARRLRLYRVRAIIPDLGHSDRPRRSRD